jgi:hypothetical protein
MQNITAVKENHFLRVKLSKIPTRHPQYKCAEKTGRKDSWGDLGINTRFTGRTTYRKSNKKSLFL